MKKKIIITGGSGFLTKNLVKHLDLNKFDVVLLTRDDAKLKDLKINYNINIKKINWENTNDIKEKFTGANYIIHTAAMVPSRSDANNSTIIKSSLKICKKICSLNLDVEKFIYISTLRTCINTKKTIFTDDTKYNFYKFDTAYGRSKYLSEKYLIKHKKNLPLIICSPAHILGPESQDKSKSNEFIYNIFKKKVNFYINTKYALVDIEDVCEAINLIIDKSNINEKYLICNFNPSFYKLISLCEEFQGKKIKIYLPMILINLISIFFESMNKIFKIKNLPINRSSFHFASLNGEFKGKKIEQLGLKYTELNKTIRKLFEFYDKN